MNEVLKKQQELLNKLSKKIKWVEDSVNELSKDLKVMEYIELTKSLEKTKQEYEDTKYEYIKTKCMCCNHKYVVTHIEEYKHDRPDIWYGCPICGADSYKYHKWLYDQDSIKDKEDLARMHYLKSRINWNNEPYVQDRIYATDSLFDWLCDEYNKEKSNHPRTSDDVILKKIKEKRVSLTKWPCRY